MTRRPAPASPRSRVGIPTASRVHRKVRPHRPRRGRAIRRGSMRRWQAPPSDAVFAASLYRAGEALRAAVGTVAQQTRHRSRAHRLPGMRHRHHRCGRSGPPAVPDPSSVSWADNWAPTDCLPRSIRPASGRLVSVGCSALAGWTALSALVSVASCSARAGSHRTSCCAPA